MLVSRTGAEREILTQDFWIHRYRLRRPHGPRHAGGLRHGHRGLLFFMTTPGMPMSIGVQKIASTVELPLLAVPFFVPLIPEQASPRLLVSMVRR